MLSVTERAKELRKARGLSFYYFDKSTAVAVIPVSGMDTDFIFEEATADYQTVTVQGQLAYRITDYERISEQLNFTVNLKTKGYYDDPLKKLTKRIVNIPLCEFPTKPPLYRPQPPRSPTAFATRLLSGDQRTDRFWL